MKQSTPRLYSVLNLLPLVEVPLHARKQVIGLMEFLDQVRVNDKRDMGRKGRISACRTVSG